MSNKSVLFWLLLSGLMACFEAKQKYRDTTELETPPRLAITEQTPVQQQGAKQEVVKKSLADSVFLDDAENPPVLKIKKLFDRSWDIVGQALDLRKIEITDKNRDEGVYYVKYDPSVDSGSKVFGNVKIFIFEDEYEEAEYRLSIVWHETETEVRAAMIRKQDVSRDEDEEEPADGSKKLIKALYDAIRDELTE